MSDVQAQATYDAGAGYQVAALSRRLDDLPACSAVPEETVARSPGDAHSERKPPDMGSDAALATLKHPPGPVFGAERDAAAPSLIYNGFNGNKRSTCTGNYEKPDMALAVGGGSFPYRIMQVNNACVALFNNQGELKKGYPKPLSKLFDGQGVRVFDPRALYDWRTGRYLIIAVDRAANQGDPDNGSYWIAISKTDNADPGGDYFVYHVPMPTGGRNAFADFPRLGQDKTTFYIASNKFDTSNNGMKFLYEEWLLLPKSSLQSGQAFSYRYIFNTKIDGRLTDTSHPANIWHPDANPIAGLFVGSKNPSIKVPNHHDCDGKGYCNGLFVWAVDPAPTPPVASAVAIPTRHSYATPPWVPAGNNGKGKTASINAGDTAIGGQVGYALGSLYAALTTKVFVPDNRSAAILFQVQPQVQIQGGVARITSAKIVDELMLDYGADSTYMATIQPDKNGNTLTVFQRSGPNRFPSAMIMVRRANSPSGTLEYSDEEVAAGEAAYLNDMWGDYTAVAPAMTEGTPIMWFAGEFTGKAMYEGWITSEWCTKIGFSYWQ
jgi:hypothetical protein